MSARANEAPVSAEALLVVEDIHTYYGEAHILQGVSISRGRRARW